jgi:GTP-binding protein
MQFVDQALIRVRAGDGGRGVSAFRREKFVPLGGPSGGDGGQGGSVVLVVDEGLSTLLDFRYRREYQAPSGEHGSNKDKYGRGGEDLELRVPPGTQVHDELTGSLIADLHTHGERFVLARGGKGGRGNIHFVTSTDRAPRRSEPGWPGEERAVRLDLKLLADVGLLGFPNVGKSSLIARISAARPKIADYPFTTLVPNLGVVRLVGERSFVVADIPGLIEGAHAGAGLGDRFLRHVERTRVLVHLLDASAGPGRTPLQDFDAINRELALFDPALAKRPQLVVLNKLDLPDVAKVRKRLTTTFARRKIRLLGISAATGEGLGELLEEIWKVLAAERRKLSTGSPAPVEGAVAAPKAQPVALKPEPNKAENEAVTPRAPKVLAKVRAASAKVRGASAKGATPKPRRAAHRREH